MNRNKISWQRLVPLLVTGLPARDPTTPDSHLLFLKEELNDAPDILGAVRLRESTHGPGRTAQ